MAEELREAALKKVLEQVLKRYRIEPEAATQVISEAFGNSEEFQQALQSAPSPKALFKMRAFKNAADAARKTIYFSLRQYKSDEDQLKAHLEALHAGREKDEAFSKELAALHASTRERLSRETEFYRQLLPHFSGVKRCADLGCGLQPIRFPWQAEGLEIEEFYALERDKLCGEILAKWQESVPALRYPGPWQLSDGFSVLGKEGLDLALLLKFVPVVLRQEKEAEALLLQLPAKKWIISGSKISLTKKKSIERRERKTLQKFIEKMGRKIVSEFEVEEEFVYVVE